MSTIEGAVRLDRREAIAYITFDRQAARNAMTWTMYEQLNSFLDWLEANRDIRVAVLRGAGGHFAAGTDIAQFRDFATGEDGLAYERRLDAVVARLEATHAATIAVVEGYAVGGGLALAAACDVRICTPDARFGVPIARTVGNCLSMANTARLVAHLGASRTKAMLVTAGLLSAQEALQSGFVTSIVEPKRLDKQVDELAAGIATLAPITLQVSREAVRRIVASLSATGDDLVRRAYESLDFQEGVTAFLEKRLPRWEGR
ncbi:MAG TPA: enoyl-CoA hydratase/isomerase family protein [Gemmatimonadaceae bacterium]|nr:enoyl-CoA hydratase/isomerase family protein [Gemmatimonadaceae bacterium]